MAFAAAATIFGALDVVLGAAGDRVIALGLTGRTHEELIAESPDTYRMYDFAARTQAWGLVTLGLLLLGILVGPYRRGEAWAWRVLWLLPGWSLSVPAMYLAFGLVAGTPLPPPFIWSGREELFPRNLPHRPSDWRELGTATGRSVRPSIPAKSSGLQV
jgi:hypothetical protein